MKVYIRKYDIPLLLKEWMVRQADKLHTIPDLGL